MIQLIDKSALVAEIERIMKSISTDRFLSEFESGCNQGKEDICDDLLSFLDTLEVKEVDIEKEIKEEYRKLRCYGGKDNMLVVLNEPNFNRIAKHFFELGMVVSNKAQKGEEEYDKWIAWLEKQGEQKPANIEPKFHKGDMIIHKELCGDYIHNPHKIIQVDILNKEYRLEGGLVAHFSEEDDYELIEQNPAWSDDDELMLTSTVNTLKLTNGAAQMKIDWLKQLKNRVQPQPKQEWGKEDEKILGKCIDAASGYYSPEDKQSMKDWLKSLKDRVQPQQKQEWSEEDEYVLKDAITALDMILTSAFQENNPNLYKSFEVAKHWLKSLKPQPHWKPTEEQIRALSMAYKDSLTSGENLITQTETLKSLYNELVKL